MDGKLPILRAVLSCASLVVSVVSAAQLKAVDFEIELNGKYVSILNHLVSGIQFLQPCTKMSKYVPPRVEVTTKMLGMNQTKANSFSICSVARCPV